jgi:hypothetical protein
VTEREDRFGDLGRPEPDRRTAGEKLEERDRTHPEPVDRPPEAPRPANRYAWVVGIVMLMVLAGLLLTSTIANNSGEGVRGPEPGDDLRTFAAPVATGNASDDAAANICQKRPCPSQAGRAPACELRSEEVVNLCELRRRPLVLTFMVTRGADCEPQVDRVERMRRAFPGVAFAVVMSGNKRSEAEKIVRRRRWTQPVAVDKDGAVVNLHGVGVCPTTVFALRGGRVVGTELGNLTEAQLSARVRRLERRQARADRRKKA